MANGAATTLLDPQGGELLERLVDSGWEFDFFRAVWLLERHCQSKAAVGERGPVADEAVRFRPYVSVGFPPTDVRRIMVQQGELADQVRYCLEVTFMGLYGVSTPLPLHYAIDVLRSVEPSGPKTDAEKKEEADRAMPPLPGERLGQPAGSPVRDFLDIFHHRLVSMFYRSWTKYRYHETFGRPNRDDVTDHMLNLVGCPWRDGEPVLGVDPIRLIRYGGLLTQHPKSGVALEGLLDDYWAGPDIHVEQCLGRWVAVPTADLNRIGSANTSLGIDLTVGEQVYDLSGLFQVSVGPVDWPTYQSFLPGGERFSQTRALVQLYCSDPLAFTIEVKLLPGEIPEMRLSSDEKTTRLGFTSWALTGEGPETSVTFEATTMAPLESEADPTAEAAASATAVGVAGV
ncbi:MAG: type VI secretion system baseplate subunit TssG [bacterium]|nr:type VI secretion system baseplate subunit TssG [bacterium]